MSALARYFHTVRHLRPVQVAARVRRLLPGPRPDLRPAPSPRARPGPYAAPIAPEPSLIAPDVVRLLGVERRCAQAADWLPADADKLWVYNLHYFDDLNARDAPRRRDWHARLLSRWVVENPPGAGDGWEPYPVSRRIVNWVRWAVQGHALPLAAQASLAVQARWLARRLEYHLLGNHLLANAKALMHAGLYFEGSEAQAWYEKGLQLFGTQLTAQLLADGGHFELSPMYHAAVLEDVLDAINLLKAYHLEIPRAWPASAAAMRRWLAVMSHPDGEISFFNDAAFGISAPLAALDDYAARLGLPPPAAITGAVVALEPSGYVRLALGSAQLLCDCAPVGPDFLPGHAHADTLSFELSLAGRRVLVNSGTSRYGTGVERQRQRATAAHNTVVVDGRDSSEVWGGFRVARRARPRLLHLAPGPPAVLEASHDGYQRLPGRNLHRRRWVLQRDSLEITDHVSGDFGRAAAFFYLHPDVTVAATGPEFVLTLPGFGAVSVGFDAGAAVEVLSGTWHPRFGAAVPNRCLKASFSAPMLATRFAWTAGQ